MGWNNASSSYRQKKRRSLKFPSLTPGGKEDVLAQHVPPCTGWNHPLAMATWRKEESKHQYFYGHSYTCPTPKKYAFQGIGVAISNAVAIHIRDVKEGKLMEPSAEDCRELENYDHLLAADTDDDLITPHDTAAADSANGRNYNLSLSRFHYHILATRFCNPTP